MQACSLKTRMFLLWQGFHTCVGSGGQRQTAEWYKENGIEVVMNFWCYYLFLFCLVCSIIIQESPWSETISPFWKVLYEDPVEAFDGKTQTLKTSSGKILKYGSLIISTGCAAARYITIHYAYISSGFNVENQIVISLPSYHDTNSCYNFVLLRGKVNKIPTLLQWCNKLNK